ncbi:ABC transporter B family member 15-like protein [Tanacetum coccineum]
MSKGSQEVKYVLAVLDRDTLINLEDPNGNKPVITTGHVEIHDVDFAYPAWPNVRIFKGFSINIKAGKSIALVGESGSGKSTIISLIERFYDPVKGIVKVDGMDISESEITEAATAANAHDFISILKDAYDTQCGERGVQLSGGQKQCIAIARAVIKNPMILLLDKATSALDSQLEKVVLRL